MGGPAAHFVRARCDARLTAKQGGSFIRIAATIAAFALLWYASFRTAAASRGAANVIAKAVFLILTCLACVAIGFFLPMVPVISSVIGSAFWAGLLATAGSLAGMGLSDAILMRLEARESGAPTGAAPRRTKRRDREREQTPQVSLRRAHSLAARRFLVTRPGTAPP